MYWATGVSSLPSGREWGRGGRPDRGTGPAPCVLSADPPSPGGSRQRRLQVVRVGELVGVHIGQHHTPLFVVRGPGVVGVDRVSLRQLGRLGRRGGARRPAEV